jgi:hypothetical protein
MPGRTPRYPSYLERLADGVQCARPGARQRHFDEPKQVMSPAHRVRPRAGSDTADTWQSLRPRQSYP